MKKNNGFTLIELLAVIVILAIIALIATPTILGIIEKAKVGSYESSAYNYVDAVEKQMAINEINSNSISDGTYDKDELTLSYKGKSPDEASVTISNSQVEKAFFKYDDYYFCYYNGSVTSSTTEQDLTDCVYTNGTIIYFNPETNSVCSKSEAVSKNNVKTGCMKWYIYNDSGSSSTVTMILDHNTTAYAYINKSQDLMTQLTTALESDTSTWDSRLIPRLITADEIAKITGNTSFDSSTATWKEKFYLETNTSTEPDPYSGKYYWLYDYTYKCSSYGCKKEDNTSYKVTFTNGSSYSYVYGYWTSTLLAGETSKAWYVHMGGDLNYTSSPAGIRPVITVSKALLNGDEDKRLKVGDYVEMTPTVSSYQTDTTMTNYKESVTINPQELNRWVVIRNNSDGTVDMVSEYLSSTIVRVGESLKTYQNIVGYLNVLASQYENKKYTIASRMFGYDSQTEYITDVSKLDMTSSTPPWEESTSELTTKEDEALGAGDMGYLTDTALVEANSSLGNSLKAYTVGTTNYGNYWLASRRYISNSVGWGVSVRLVSYNGTISSWSMAFHCYDACGGSDWGLSLRPIVTVKANVIASSGSGTSSDPYILD
jgi:type IV pilus assembly protein PilA